MISYKREKERERERSDKQRIAKMFVRNLLYGTYKSYLESYYWNGIDNKF